MRTSIVVIASRVNSFLGTSGSLYDSAIFNIASGSMPPARSQLSDTFDGCWKCAEAWGEGTQKLQEKGYICVACNGLFGIYGPVYCERKRAQPDFGSTIH